MPLTAVTATLHASAHVQLQCKKVDTLIASLERGKMAEFLALDENPLDVFLNILSLKCAVQGTVDFDGATAEKIEISEIAVSSNG